MRLFRKIRFMLVAAYKAGTVYDQFASTKFETNRLLGEIVRYTHSIEKGLSLEKVRLGFGYEKIKEARGFIKRYEELKGTIDVEQVRMFSDAVDSYLKFHRLRKYESLKIREIESIYDEIVEKLGKMPGKFGGTVKVTRPNYNGQEIKIIERVITERHSVREFDGTPVSEDKLQSAIKLAMHCPSACNRQCYRVTIIGKKEFPLLRGWTDGIGGFADDLDRMLLITGKISDYRPTEQFQYLITPAVFAGYLTIALQAYGIGCCFIQRALVPNKKYTNIAKILSIPEDEQSVCILGIGNLKDEYTVPISHRFDYNSIVRKLNIVGGGKPE